MKTLYFIRHGQSVANIGGKSLPDIEIPLTVAGQKQAQELVKKFPISPSKIYSSELLRAKQTAQVFAHLYQIPSETLTILNEFSYLGFENINDMDGQERRKLAQLYWEKATIEYRDHHDSDCFQDFLDRVDLFIRRIDFFNDNSLFFGHGIWIALLAWRLLGCPIETALDIKAFRQFQTALPLDNTVIYKLSISQDGVKQLQKFDLLSQ
jgi:broad specificity phosphatase PhoE